MLVRVRDILLREVPTLNRMVKMSRVLLVSRRASISAKRDDEEAVFRADVSEVRFVLAVLVLVCPDDRSTDELLFEVLSEAAFPFGLEISLLS